MADLTARLKTFWFDFRTDLPQWISVGIGQAAAEWSVVEREMEELIRILVNGETQQTRILTYRINAKTRNLILKELIESHILHGTIPAKCLKQFLAISKATDPIQDQRDY
jgi:hypothetical protein